MKCVCTRKDMGKKNVEDFQRGPLSNQERGWELLNE